MGSSLCRFGKKNRFDTDALTDKGKKHRTEIDCIRHDIFTQQKEISQHQEDLDNFERMSMEEMVQNKGLWVHMRETQQAMLKQLSDKYRDWKFHTGIVTLIERQLTQRRQYESAAELTELIGGVDVGDVITQMDRIAEIEENMEEVDAAVTQNEVDLDEALVGSSDTAFEQMIANAADERTHVGAVGQTMPAGSTKKNQDMLRTFEKRYLQFETGKATETVQSETSMPSKYNTMTSTSTPSSAQRPMLPQHASSEENNPYIQRVASLVTR